MSDLCIPGAQHSVCPRLQHLLPLLPTDRKAEAQGGRVTCPRAHSTDPSRPFRERTEPSVTVRSHPLLSRRAGRRELELAQGLPLAFELQARWSQSLHIWIWLMGCLRQERGRTHPILPQPSFQEQGPPCQTQHKHTCLQGVLSQPHAPATLSATFLLSSVS